MSNFTPDMAQEKALASWYLPDNPLHLEARHPLIKLAGEAGEILDLFGKHEYKPEFDWWNCKHCEMEREYHSISQISGRWLCDGFTSEAVEYTPLILDELGDYSYYLRIITYQQSISFEMLCDGFEPFTTCLEELLNDLAYRSVRLHKLWLKTKKVNAYELQILTFIFLSILQKLEVSLEEVLNLNYKKLNSEETQHGWSSAR